MRNARLKGALFLIMNFKYSAPSLLRCSNRIAIYTAKSKSIFLANANLYMVSASSKNLSVVIVYCNLNTWW